MTEKVQCSVDAGKGVEDNEPSEATVTVVIAVAFPATFRASSQQHSTQRGSATVQLGDCSWL